MSPNPYPIWCPATSTKSQFPAGCSYFLKDISLITPIIMVDIRLPVNMSKQKILYVCYHSFSLCHKCHLDIVHLKGNGLNEIREGIALFQPLLLNLRAAANAFHSLNGILWSACDPWMPKASMG